MWELNGCCNCLRVPQVAKASASDEQGQRRLLLSINHKGTILQVNKGTAWRSQTQCVQQDYNTSMPHKSAVHTPGIQPAATARTGCTDHLMLVLLFGAPSCAADTPKALYGFEPSQLLGRPLAAALDVFGHWRHHFGEDGSLLALLAEHSMDEESVQGSGSGGRSSAVGPSWRVGVHLPVKSDDDIAAHAALMATDTHLGAQVGCKRHRRQSTNRCKGEQHVIQLCLPAVHCYRFTLIQVKRA